MKFFSLFISLFVAIYSASSWANDDLLTVFEMSLNNDPELLAEAASLRAVNELDNQATARFLPQINLSANNGQVRRKSSAETFGVDAKYNEHGYTLNLTQSLFRRQNYIQDRQADIAISSAQASYDIAVQALIVRVAERYFEFLASQDELSFAVAEKKANGKQLEQVQQRFDIGLATITDLTESQAGYDLAHTAVIRAENVLANSKERLRETTGHYFDSLATLKAKTPLVSPEPAQSEEWVSLALEQNPSLVVVKKARENANQVIELQKSDHYPTLDIVGQTSFNSQSETSFGGSSKTHQDSISLQVNLPIFQGGDVVSRTREATHRLDQAMQDEEQQRRTVLRQSREAFNDVMSGISQVKALKQAVQSNEKALESTEAGYEVGTRTTVDVLNVRRDLFRARSDYADARYNYILSSLRLKQAAGVLEKEDIALINEWLEK